MNKRIIIIDDDPKSGVDLYRWFGSGQLLTYTVSHIDQMGDQDRSQVLSLGPSDGAILVGPGAFTLIRQMYHIGIRGENYSDCSLLRRLGISSGAFIKVYRESDRPGLDEINYFISPEFTRVREFPDYSWQIVKTWEQVVPVLEYLENLPVGTESGFDYETSGMPLIPDLQVPGAAIAIGRGSVYFSFQDLSENLTKEQFDHVKDVIGRFLGKHQENIWTYNTQFEQQVTFRYFGVEAAFPDTGVYNVLDGIHFKNFSLKWTIQRLLGGGDTCTPGLSDRTQWDKGGILPWDTDFDYLTDILNTMYYGEAASVKGNRPTDLIVTPASFESTKEWEYICSRYPEYIDQFKTLILRNFGNPFMNIPSDILGYYCCLDAYYTLKARQEHKNRYSTVCHEVFLNNMKLGALLHRGGMFKDEQFRAQYEEECRHMEAYGIIYSATSRCYRKIMSLTGGQGPSGWKRGIRADWVELIKNSSFFSGSATEIVKHLLKTNLNQAYDTGFDEAKVMMTYGEKLAVFLSDTLAARMKEIKFKGQIDETVVRKKKLIGLLSTDLAEFLKLPEKPSKAILQAESIQFFQRAYDEFMKIWEAGLTIDDVPAEFEFMGKRYSREEFTKFVRETYFNSSSPIGSAEVTKELILEFPTESVFLATIYSGINKLPDGKRFFKNLGITTPKDGWNAFMSEWKLWWNRDKSSPWPGNNQVMFPEEIWHDAYDLWSSIDEKKDPAEALETCWNNFDGYLKQSTYFGLPQDWDLMKKPYSEEDWTLDRFQLARKILVHIMIEKKYRKMRTAYVGSGQSGMPDDKPAMFYATDKSVIVDPKSLMPIREAYPGEPGAVTKMFPHYEVMKKETKRWSSGYHTIISHSDVKDVISAPRGMLLGYFDISSAEVRTAAYRSKDPVMIHLFETGQDLYIHAAKLYFKEQWENMDGPERAKWRKSFKTILLGVMYGMGTKTLAGRLGVPEPLAETLVNTMMSEFCVLKQYIDANMAWPGQHNGYIRQVYGDTLRSRSWPYRIKPDGRLDKFADLQVQRHGINWLIQSGSALTLAAGFYNNVIEGRHDDIMLIPIIVVHDSNTNYFPIDSLFDLRSEYDRNFTGYCADPARVDSPFLFDLLIGPAYQSAAEVKHIGNDTIKMKASAHVLNGILNKIDTESRLVVETDIPRESIIPDYVTSRMERFIREGGCSILMDRSEYEVTIKKLGYTD